MSGQVWYIWGIMFDMESTEKNAVVYGNLLSRFREDIRTGRIAAGSLLPGEMELARVHGLSRWSVREMLAKLSEEGLVHKIAGKGTLVVERPTNRTFRTPITVDVILDNTNKLDANEYAMEFLRRIEANAQTMRRPFTFSSRLMDFTGHQQEDLAGIGQVQADATVILPYSRQCRDFLEMCRGTDRLLIATAAELSSPVIPQVFVDDVEGTKKGVRYLQHIRHRKIKMVAPDEYCYRNGHSRIRQDTFVERMRETDCLWVPPHQITASVACAYGPVRKLITEWMTGDQAPTALFVADGNWLAPTRAALELLGKKIPADISVISYDDVLEARVSDPATTVIRQPLDAAARRIYEVMLDHLEKTENAKLKNRVSPELVVRESSAPPADKS